MKYTPEDLENFDINELETKYLHYSEEYYKGNTQVSDEEFDELKEILILLDSKIIDLVDGDNTPGQRYPHMNPMLSLEKIQVMDPENLPLDKVQDFLNKSNGTLVEGSPKMDGSAMDLKYVDGVLKQALTRGNEQKGGGLDRTDKMRFIVPEKIDLQGVVEIRGEVVIKADLYFSKYADPNNKKNPRNFVSGKISEDEIIPEVLNDLDFVAYHLVIDADNLGYKDYHPNTMETLLDLGFNQKFNPLTLYFLGISDFPTVFEKFTKYRETSPYQLDGFVLKFHEEVRKDLGENNHHPHWAVAIKFPPKEAQTIIRNIEWEPGTTGRFTPVAIFEPVDLDGTEVKRASLHNYGKVMTNETFVGATVLIAKKGDIIPQVLKVVQKATSMYITTMAPSHCPICSDKLQIIDSPDKKKTDTKHLMCNNADCEGKAQSKLEVGIKILKIEEIGGPTVEKLFIAGIKHISDLFDKNKFNKQTLINSGEFKEGKQLENKLNAVSAIKEVTLAQVIDSLKLKDIGTSISEVGAKIITGISYDAKSLNKAAIANLQNPLSKERKKIYEFMCILKLAGINIILPEEEIPLSADAITVEMSGTPPKTDTLKTKSDYLDLFAKYNVHHADLKKGTTYLITDSHSSSSSKMAKARKLGIEILTYEEFITKHCK